MSVVEELALTYNDKSPMENMHASICFQTLRGEGLNFMQAASRQKYVVAWLASSCSTVHDYQLIVAIVGLSPSIH